MTFRSVLTVLWIFLSIQSRASTEGHSPPSSCASEIEHHCPGVARGPELLGCLARHQSEASPLCQQEIQRLLEARKQAAGNRGLGAFSGVMGGMSMGGPPIPVLIAGGGSTRSDEPQAHAETWRLNASTPVARAETDFYTASLSYSTLRFGDEIRLRDSGVVLARDWRRMEVGGQFSRRLEGEKLLSLRLSVGSAGDEPFRQGRDTTFTFNGTYSFPESETTHWAWTLFISNNNPIANYLPIPGFVYFYRTPTFTGMFGIPFATVQWTPVPDWILSAAAFGPSVNLEAAHGGRDRLQTALGFNWSQQTFLRADRIYEEDRTFLDEKRLFVAVRSPLSAKFSAELQAGPVFDRLVYEGRRFRSFSGGKRELNNASFIGASLRATLF